MGQIHSFNQHLLSRHYMTYARHGTKIQHRTSQLPPRSLCSIRRDRLCTLFLMLEVFKMLRENYAQVIWRGIQKAPNYTEVGQLSLKVVRAKAEPWRVNRHFTTKVREERENKNSVTWKNLGSNESVFNGTLRMFTKL